VPPLSFHGEADRRADKWGDGGPLASRPGNLMIGLGLSFVLRTVEVESDHICLRCCSRGQARENMRDLNVGS
jgi:hypothetical protein